MIAQQSRDQHVRACAGRTSEGQQRERLQSASGPLERSEEGQCPDSALEEPLGWCCSGGAASGPGQGWSRAGSIQVSFVRTVGHSTPCRTSWLTRHLPYSFYEPVLPENFPTSLSGRTAAGDCSSGRARRLPDGLGEAPEGRGRPRGALVGLQLVLEGGGGDGLLPSDAAGGAPHQLAHVHNRRYQLIAALRVRPLLRRPRRPVPAWARLAAPTTQA